MITASSLERALACHGSVVLPQARTTSEWAQQGTDNHAAHEAAINAGELPDEIARFLGAAAKTARAEVKLALNVATGEGRIIGCGGDRVYADQDGPFWYYGSTDLLAYDDEAVYIVDHKLYQSVASAAANVQTGFYATAAAAALNRQEARIGISYESGRLDTATLDMIDMDSLRARMRNLHIAVAEQQSRYRRGELVDVNQGPHCRHCPSIHACPASVSLIKRLANGGEASDLEMMMPLDDETARIAYERIGHARNLLKRIESAIYARAAEKPIPLGDGRFLGKHTKEGNEQLDGRIVRDVVTEMLGAGAVDEVVTIDATKTALKDAIRKRAPKGGAAKLERDVMTAIRAKGGATRKESETIGEFTATLEIAKGDAA